MVEFSVGVALVLFGSGIAGLRVEVAEPVVLCGITMARHTVGVVQGISCLAVGLGEFEWTQAGFPVGGYYPLLCVKQ
jgi:hypothetical protein